MFRINLQPHALANFRFTYSPMLELTTSYRLLRGNWASALYWAWIEEARQSISKLDWPYMDALITYEFTRTTYGQLIPNGYIPDFLTPTPLYPVTDIESEFERILAMPDDLIRDGIQTLIGHVGESDLLCNFLAFPRYGLQKLIAEMREYWQRTLAHHWGRMMTVLENDILHHSRVLTLHGLEALFPDLDPSLAYGDGVILFQKQGKACSVETIDPLVPLKKELMLESNSFHLTPVIFAGNAVYHQLQEPWQPMLLYTPRGAGLWNYETPEPSEAFELTLGAGKARVLLALIDPLSTGELAYKLSLTAGAVSQQLSKLHQAGLVESHRSGKNVFYRLTMRGNQLVELFS
jgi:DNA-binding HxlR family transcriptional regulator